MGWGWGYLEGEFMWENTKGYLSMLADVERSAVHCQTFSILLPSGFRVLAKLSVYGLTHMLNA
jgi:hypothetical protein